MSQSPHAQAWPTTLEEFWSWHMAAACREVDTSLFYSPEGDEAEVLATAIDRVEAWDKSQELGPWVTNTRPGIGVRAYEPGARWGASLRSAWGRDL